MNYRQEKEGKAITIDEKIKLSDETIKTSVEILLIYFLDYVNRGGDMTKLSASEIFDKRR